MKVVQQSDTIVFKYTIHPFQWKEFLFYVTYRIKSIIIFQTVDFLLECGETKAHVKGFQAVGKAVNNLAYNRIQK